MISKAWFFLLIKLSADIISVNLSFILAYMIVFKTLNLFGLPLMAYIKVLALISLFWLIIFNLAGLYKVQSDRANRIDGVFSVSFGVFSSAFLTYVFLEYLYREAIYSQKIVMVAFAIDLFLMNFIRFLLWRISYGDMINKKIDG